MSLYVNLLKKSEQRFQGIVSMKVMVFGSLSVLAGTMILVLLLAGISKVTLRSNLDRARHELECLEPHAAMLRTVQSAILANRKTMSGMEGWSTDTRLPMYRVLRSVQENIPSQMMLYHFSAEVEPVSEKDPLTYSLRVSGTANGELTAIETKRQLNASADLRKFCGEIKLISSQRYFGDAWAFALEGHRLSGGAK